jgi:acetyltransferase-like isoleucine patch superfamily enzyme
MSRLKKLLNSVLSKVLDPYLKEYLKKNLPTQYLVFGDDSRLKIAKTAVVNNALFNLSSGNITIEDYAFFGHNVTILTGTHDYQKLNRERQVSAPIFGRDVLIERGAWIASNATILGPCTIGEHAVVAAGALVNKDVPPYAVVTGVPAKIIKEIKRHRDEIPIKTSSEDEVLLLENLGLPIVRIE